jgi:hypothetical protein
MKKAALYLCFVVLLVSLLIGCDGGVEPPVDMNVERFIGTWLNVDQNTEHITKIYIDEINGYLSIEEWGKCYPDDCAWEKKLVKKDDAIDAILNVSWLYASEKVLQEIVLLDDPYGRLKVTTAYSYPSGYGWPDWSMIDNFFKSQ